MEYIYKVCENLTQGRSVGRDCGLMYFSTYDKAKEEYDRRVEFLSKLYGAENSTETLEGSRDRIFLIHPRKSENMIYRVALEMHDLY